MTDDIQREVKTNPDGSKTVTTSFSLSGEPRPVSEDVVEAIDAALGGLGGEVMHQIDPTRMLDVDKGGPPVWSIGMVEVDGDLPYSLLVTYGFSEVVSPTELRRGLRHEYSIAVPKGQPLDPWAGALLRHLTRYVYRTGRDLETGQIMPCHMPITRCPFPPEDHAAMPETELDAIAVGLDPVLPQIDTPRGSIDVRRLVGVTPDERDQIETWSAGGFLDEYRRVDPTLVTDLERPSILGDRSVAERCQVRAAEEGSNVPAFMANVAWVDEGDDLVLCFGSGAIAQKVAEGIRNRLGFGERLLVVGTQGYELGFRPSDRPSVEFQGPAVLIGGRPDDSSIVGSLLAQIDAAGPNAGPMNIPFRLG